MLQPHPAEKSLDERLAYGPACFAEAADVTRVALTARHSHSRLVPVQPHALDGHAPALVGPLPVLTLNGDEAGAAPGGGLQEFLDTSDRVVDVAVLR